MRAGLAARGSTANAFTDANWSPLSDTGITIIPGIDALPGYSLHHELELYVRAGIPAPEVLRMATLTPTIVTPSSIRPSPSSLSLHGDPAKIIRDTRNITTVIKGGKVYDPAAIEKALGIAPHPPRP